MNKETRHSILLKLAASNVIAHFAGPSGSGKTTLMLELKRQLPNLLVVDLDDFDDYASVKLFGDKSKKDYSNQDIAKLAKARQLLLNKFINTNGNKKIVLVGHHFEGDQVLDVHTENKYMLDTSPLLSAWRAFIRSQNEQSNYRRSIYELNMDYREANDVIKRLRELGYTPISFDAAVAKVKELEYNLS